MRGLGHLFGLCLSRSRVCTTSELNNMVYFFELYIDITGGTGRFEGATGRFLLEGTDTLDGYPPPSFMEDISTWVGTITY
jgi:hypothetical protein